MTHTWFKVFHLVGIVVWFSGLFYLVRLFVYHAEAEAKPEPARTILKEQFALMEARLWSMICQPGAALALGMGVAMLVADSTWLSYGWLHVKLGFVALLVLYHGACGNWRKQLAAGTCTLTYTSARE